MVVSPRPSHPFGIDVVGHDIAASSERYLTDGALPPLLDNFAVKQLPHLRIGTQFAISPRMVRVIDTLNAQASDPASLLGRLAATTIEESVDGTVFLATEFHGLPPMFFFCWVGNMPTTPPTKREANHHGLSRTGAAVLYSMRRWYSRFTEAPSTEPPRAMCSLIAVVEGSFDFTQAERLAAKSGGRAAITWSQSEPSILDSKRRRKSGTVSA
jgi:hypothetical protein